MPSLPVDEALPRLKAVLAKATAAVLVAPPGAGKTTRVPLALLDAAWLGPGPVAGRLGGATLVESAGRMFPVQTRYLDREASSRFEDSVAGAVRGAIAAESGSALVFLPGVGEIRRVEERLAGLPDDVDVVPLYGDLSPAEQDRAIAPASAGRRKVVLATSIAATSLTIEGVRLVIDGGHVP